VTRKPALGFVLLTGYGTWKIQDKHAQAFAVLKGSRGRQMGTLLQFKDVSTQEEAGCLNCHGMNFPKSRQGGSYDIHDGVSCGGCHGPSEKWLGTHNQPAKWRPMSPEAKYQDGMLDVRDPVKRSQMCMSCHIGNAAEGKIVTHAMYAAGHPPLPPIEIATFASNLPQHWRDAKDVPYFQNPSPETRKNYHLEAVDYQRTKLALISSVVAFRESMRLIAVRADLRPPDAPSKVWTVWPELVMSLEGKSVPQLDGLAPAMVNDRWPEIALGHSDCYACHQDLQTPDWRQDRGYAFHLPLGLGVPYKPGRPQFRPWPMALLELSVRHGCKDEDAVRKRFTDLQKNLHLFSQLCDDRPFGEPGKVVGAARDMIAWCDEVIADLNSATYGQAESVALLHKVCALTSLEYADYDSARQIASVFKVIFDELKEKGPRAGDLQNLLRQMETDLNMRPYSHREQRLEKMMGVVKKAAMVEELKGMKEYLEALKHLDKPDLQNGLIRNDFLNLIQAGVDNKTLTDKIEENIGTLQEFSDEELVEALKKINQYNPKEFKRRMSELEKLLPSP